MDHRQIRIKLIELISPTNRPTVLARDMNKKVEVIHPVCVFVCASMLFNVNEANLNSG